MVQDDEEQLVDDGVPKVVAMSASYPEAVATSVASSSVHQAHPDGDDVELLLRLPGRPRLLPQVCEGQVQDLGIKIAKLITRSIGRSIHKRSNLGESRGKYHHSCCCCPSSQN